MLADRTKCFRESLVLGSLFRRIPDLLGRVIDQFGHPFLELAPLQFFLGRLTDRSGVDLLSIPDGFEKFILRHQQATGNTHLSAADLDVNTFYRPDFLARDGLQTW